MNFEIAIPSYNRATKLRDQTLKYLQTEGIDPQRITVFVASAEELFIYANILTPGTYKELVVGHLGLTEQRMFIEAYYPLGTHLLQMDDDIKKIKMLQKKPLLDVCNRMFALCSASGCNLWSIYPVNNLFFCKERIIKGKVFCVGCFFGLINTKDQAYPSVSCVEDKWRSLYRYKTDGATLRYEGCCPDTIYNARGGLYEHRLLHRDQEVREVCKMFPYECHFKRRKNQVAEVIWKQKIAEVFSFTWTDESDSLQI